LLSEIEHKDNKIEGNERIINELMNKNESLMKINRILDLENRVAITQILNFRDHS